ncbi:MAG: hypothetical protein ACF8PG_15675 [Maioricimonas sp. JB045]
MVNAPGPVSTGRREVLLSLIAVAVLSGGRTVTAEDMAAPLEAVQDRQTPPILQVAGQDDGHGDASPQIRVDVIDQGTSSRRIRGGAIKALPTQYLSAQHRQAANEILSSLSLYRRLPVIRCDVDPRVYGFFTTHPDVAVSIWRAMGISKLQMFQTGPNEYESDLGDGTFGVITVLHRSRNSYLILCEGQFNSPLLTKPIQSRALMHLQTSAGQDRNGQHYVTQQADLFVSFPSQTVDTIARIVSPVSNRMADKNFEEVSLFVRMMDVAMHRQPGWVEQISQKLDGILPGSREKLLDVTSQVYVDARRQALREAGMPVSVDEVIPPVQVSADATMDAM